MQKRKRRQRGWLEKILFGTALGLSQAGGLLYAQQEPPTRAFQIIPAAAATTTATAQQPEIGNVLGESVLPPTNFSPASAPIGDPFAPAWVDPISRVPNFFGDFVARGSQACRNTFSTQTLTFTGTGAEGGSGFSRLHVPFTGPNGPGGPYTLTKDIPVHTTVPPNYTLSENGELTPQVRAQFPGATFIDGSGMFVNFRSGTFLYHYLFTTGQNVCVNLPNPSGGGLVGRNLYFDNGSPLPRDRVYFFYNHVGNFQGLGSSFDVNRYVFGVEKTFLDNLFSIELRVPFAGTANSDQVAGQDLAVNHCQFGNLGLALKGVLYRTPNFVASIGMGFSLPTADDSRMLVGDTPVVVIQNRTCLLQPMLGVAWAPNDRFYTQLGLQFDIDPSGNPVQMLDGDGGLSRAGVLHDQAYAFLKAATGYWIYQNDERRLSGIALQVELDYDRSFGSHGAVVNGPVTVTDLTSRINVLNGNAGAIFQFGERTRLSVGIGFPLAGERVYNWNLTAQLNYQFGRR